MWGANGISFVLVPRRKRKRKTFREPRRSNQGDADARPQSPQRRSRAARRGGQVGGDAPLADRAPGGRPPPCTGGAPGAREVGVYVQHAHSLVKLLSRRPGSYRSRRAGIWPRAFYRESPGLCGADSASRHCGGRRPDTMQVPAGVSTHTKGVSLNPLLLSTRAPKTTAPNYP